MPGPIETIVILGGGAAGWMAAAALAKAWQFEARRIVVIESEEIGIVGVGEASVPTIHGFNGMLGLDPAEFLRACNGTFKLGIEFVDWGERGRRYMHPFTLYGADVRSKLFPNLWLKYAQGLQARGETSLLDDYNLASMAAVAGRFVLPRPGQPAGIGPLNYAFHFDASLYAACLRAYAERRGVARIEGKVGSVEQDAETGFVTALKLESGARVAGDFFIDCSGFRGVIIEQALKCGYDDWSRWLPCDRAVAVASAPVGPVAPFTRSTADDAGWRWRIPLQHRIGNGYVYASGYLADDAAEARLLETIDGAPLADPRRLRFTTGRRRRAWDRNCLALGLASGFMEPLESTSIHLIQTAILRLLSLFPDKGFEAVEINEFNRQTQEEHENIRDFLITHYKLTTRDDTAFWRFCRDMDVPERVRENLALFAARGRLAQRPEHLFSAQSWQAVLIGQGQLPRGYDPLLYDMPAEALDAQMRQTHEALRGAVAAMPPHDVFLKAFCAER